MYPTGALPGIGLRRARLALAAVFFANGFGLGSWVPHIADVKRGLAISDGVLGMTLLAFAVGSLVGLPAAGAIAARCGSRAATRLGAALFCLTLPLPLLAPGVAWLAAGLAALGFASGALDVAMNSNAVEVEACYRRPIMSSLHGLFSAGGLFGAAAAGLAAPLGIDPAAHILIVTAGLAACIAVAFGVLLGTPRSAARRPAFAWPQGRLLALGGLALCGLLAEGAIGDWSAVYLRDVVDAGPTVAALGFAGFSLTMACGRFAGDRVVERFGPAWVLIGGSAGAAAALAAALLAGGELPAILGFAGVGIGLANLIPIVFGAAGRLPEFAPGVAIAAVSSAGYCGFLAGPPLIGLVAEIGGLTFGLCVVAAALAAMVAGGRVVAAVPETAADDARLRVG